MIGHLRGRLLEKEPSGLVVEAAGVGYSVAVPLSTFTQIDGDEVDLFIHTVVRSDAIQLFGFVRREERELFRKLIAVQGVGPMTALAILSGLSFEELVSAIHTGDAKRLNGIPRVGKKTAERVCLELKERLGDISAGVPAVPGAPDSLPMELSDALVALENLGYKTSQAKEALLRARTDAPQGPLEHWIRLALKALAR